MSMSDMKKTWGKIRRRSGGVRPFKPAGKCVCVWEQAHEDSNNTTCMRSCRLARVSWGHLPYLVCWCHRVTRLFQTQDRGGCRTLFRSEVVMRTHIFLVWCGEIAPPRNFKVAGLRRQKNLHVDQNYKRRAQRRAGNSHAWDRLCQSMSRPFEALHAVWNYSYDVLYIWHFLRDGFVGVGLGGGLSRPHFDVLGESVETVVRRRVQSSATTTTEHLHVN